MKHIYVTLMAFLLSSSCFADFDCSKLISNPTHSYATKEKGEMGPYISFGAKNETKMMLCFTDSCGSGTYTCDSRNGKFETKDLGGTLLTTGYYNSDLDVMIMDHPKRGVLWLYRQ